MPEQADLINNAWIFLFERGTFMQHVLIGRDTTIVGRQFCLQP